MKCAIFVMFVLALIACVASDPLPEHCAKLCNLNYLPVCAEDDGKLLNFGNKCAFDVWSCEHKKNLPIKFEHECPQEE